MKSARKAAQKETVLWQFCVKSCHLVCYQFCSFSLTENSCGKKIIDFVSNLVGLQVSVNRER